jgi:hypothetical protein
MMHRLIMNTPKELVVDHINHNKRDNREANLRNCTRQENQRNCRSLLSDKHSKYKGVFWNHYNQKWEVQIVISRRNKYLGLFLDEIAAANCYNYWAKHYFGEFAYLNDVPYMPKEEWESKKYLKKRKTFQYKGVCFVNGKWRAQIWDGKRNIKIGDFDTEIEAALAYNNKAIELKGDKAILNEIPIK